MTMHNIYHATNRIYVLELCKFSTLLSTHNHVNLTFLNIPPDN